MNNQQINKENTRKKKNDDGLSRVRILVRLEFRDSVLRE